MVEAAPSNETNRCCDADNGDSSAQEIALSALAGQGHWGHLAQLARDFGVHRQRIYDLRETARSALTAAFAPPEAPMTPPLAVLTITHNDAARAVIALRVVTPASLRDLQEALRMVLGIRWSYGKIQGVLDRANQRAQAVLLGVDLSGVTHIALDEVFVHARPIFSGMDLDSGYLFALETTPRRDAAEWSAQLTALREDQGLSPTAVVKDAGAGMAIACPAVWPDIEDRDDLFHAVWEVGCVKRRLEGRAYAAIAAYDALRLDSPPLYPSPKPRYPTRCESMQRPRRCPQPTNFKVSASVSSRRLRGRPGPGPQRIPFDRKASGDLAFWDMNSAVGGNASQVVRVWRRDDAQAVAARDLVEFLETIADEMVHGH